MAAVNPFQDHPRKMKDVVGWFARRDKANNNKLVSGQEYGVPRAKENSVSGDVVHDGVRQPELHAPSMRKTAQRCFIQSTVLGSALSTAEPHATQLHSLPLCWDQPDSLFPGWLEPSLTAALADVRSRS
ncbi:hypothetical protein K456DRAFT_300359 [Colletotrichum gloeosporioides 23]|nr:hypothetical protein K456DRAFT_300359 [Colletotrichum gloeosporioides 23]